MADAETTQLLETVYTNTQEGAHMLKIRLDIEYINYEKCSENLIPQLVEEMKSKTNTSELEKLFIALGADAVLLAKKLLHYLDTDVRDQILVWLLDEFGADFVVEINDYLTKIFPGQAIVIGGLSAEDYPGTRITLYATQVKINYEQLLKSPVFSGNVLGGAAKLAFHMANPGIIEKQGINILSSEKIKSKLVPVISESLQKAGLMLELRDLELQEDISERLAGKTHEKKDILPDNIEEPIIEALAAFLKCTVQ